MTEHRNELDGNTCWIHTQQDGEDKYIITLVVLNRSELSAKNRTLLDRIQEQDKQEEMNEQMRDKYALSNIATSAETKEEDSPADLYFRLRELMKDPQIFTNPNINRKIIAERLGTNEKYVFDTIKKFYGTNISNYVNKLRLDYARGLLILSNDNLTIEAIALNAGFNSRSVFYRLFKKRYGMPPLEFRRLIADS